MTVEKPNKKEIGAWIVEGILPFFGVVFVVTVLAIPSAIILDTKLSLLHLLIVPSIAGIIYASYDVHKRT